MAVYYFDTSALVKRYFQEDGTTWVREITNPLRAQEIYTVRITGPEMIAAFFLKVRKREVTHNEALSASTRFKTDLTRQYQILEITAGVADRAMSLAQEHNLRGYDSVQLAAASEIHTQRGQRGLTPLTFICASHHEIRGFRGVKHRDSEVAYQLSAESPELKELYINIEFSHRDTFSLASFARRLEEATGIVRNMVPAEEWVLQ